MNLRKAPLDARSKFRNLQKTDPELMPFPELFWYFQKLPGRFVARAIRECTERYSWPQLFTKSILWSDHPSTELESARLTFSADWCLESNSSKGWRQARGEWLYFFMYQATIQQVNTMMICLRHQGALASAARKYSSSFKDQWVARKVADRLRDGATKKKKASA